MSSSGISAAFDSREEFQNICRDLQQTGKENFEDSFKLACLSEFKNENVKEVAKMLQDRSNDTSSVYTKEQHAMFNKHVVTIKKIGNDISSDLSTIFSKLSIKDDKAQEDKPLQKPSAASLNQRALGMTNDELEKMLTERPELGENLFCADSALIISVLEKARKLGNVPTCIMETLLKQKDSITAIMLKIDPKQLWIIDFIVDTFQNLKRVGIRVSGDRADNSILERFKSTMAFKQEQCGIGIIGCAQIVNKTVQVDKQAVIAQATLWMYEIGETVAAFRTSEENAAYPKRYFHTHENVTLV